MATSFFFQTLYLTFHILFMKHILTKVSFIVLVLCLLIISTVFSQDRKPYEMIVSGVKVIVQPSGNEIVQIQTVFKGGVQNYQAEKAGIEQLAIRGLSECGTVNDDKNSFKNKLDKVSAYVNGFSSNDYASFNLNCIKADLPKVWPLYTDALTVPAFNEKDFDRIKTNALNTIRVRNSQPDASLSSMAKRVAFKGKDYAKDPLGTEASVTSITAAEARDHYRSIANKNQMFVVVVADIDKVELTNMLTPLLAKFPEGKPFVLKRNNYAPRSNTFEAEKKELATNYIMAVGGAPLAGTKEYNAFVLAMRIIYNRHFLEVRTNNGLSYAPQAYFDGGLTSSSVLSVSTTDPNKYIQVLGKLIDSTRKKGFDEQEVKNMKTTYITQLYYNQETNSAQAGSFASNEVLHNNWRRAITLNDDMKNITAKDVSNAFNKYMSNLTWVYQGDPGKVNPTLYTRAVAKEKLPPASLIKKPAKQ
jgi:predicted Zn-dependent peptidase